MAAYIFRINLLFILLLDNSEFKWALFLFYLSNILPIKHKWKIRAYFFRDNFLYLEYRKMVNHGFKTSLGKLGKDLGSMQLKKEKELKLLIVLIDIFSWKNLFILHKILSKEREGKGAVSFWVSIWTFVFWTCPRILDMSKISNSSFFSSKDWKV